MSSTNLSQTLGGLGEEVKALAFEVLNKRLVTTALRRQPLVPVCKTYLGKHRRYF